MFHFLFQRASKKLTYSAAFASKLSAILLLLCGLPRLIYASQRIYAIYDPICDEMVADPPSPEQLLANSDAPYFDAPIAKTILLLDLCEKSQASQTWQQAWAKYAAQFGYTLESVSPNTAEIRKIDNLESEQAKDAAIASQRRCQLAQKKQGWRLLHERGGVMVDLSIAPPLYRHSPIDLSRLTPLRGLVALAAAKPQNVRHFMGGLTVSDAIVMASAGHPVIAALVQQLEDNEKSLNQHYHNVDETYEVGHVFFSRVVSGALTVSPRSFLTQFEMVSGGEDALSIP